MGLDPSFKANRTQLPGRCLLKTHCCRSRLSAYWLPSSLPVKSRSWHSAMCPKPNFGLSKCLPDTGRLTRQVMFAGLTVEFHKAALHFTTTESGRVPRHGVSPQAGQAEIHITQRVTAAKRCD